MRRSGQSRSSSGRSHGLTDTPPESSGSVPPLWARAADGNASSATSAASASRGDTGRIFSSGLPRAWPVLHRAAHLAQGAGHHRVRDREAAAAAAARASRRRSCRPPRPARPPAGRPSCPSGHGRGARSRAAGSGRCRTRRRRGPRGSGPGARARRRRGRSAGSRAPRPTCRAGASTSMRSARTLPAIAGARRSARSLRSSNQTISASWWGPSPCTWTVVSSCPATTWALVTTIPSDEATHPDPSTPRPHAVPSTLTTLGPAAFTCGSRAIRDVGGATRASGPATLGIGSNRASAFRPVPRAGTSR